MSSDHRDETCDDGLTQEQVDEMEERDDPAFEEPF